MLTAKVTIEKLELEPSETQIVVRVSLVSSSRETVECTIGNSAMPRATTTKCQRHLNGQLALQVAAEEG